MEGADRISSLPSEVIVSILSHLPIKDAVRTSVLACSWRHLWTFRSHLSLGWSGDPLLFGDTCNSGRQPVASSWIERAHHVVSSLRGPLLHFAFCQRFSSDQSALLQRLLDLLLQKGSLETLHLSTGWVAIHLPSFHSLKKLELYRCRIVLPTGFQGFRRLSTLSLHRVQISNDDLNLLIHISNNLTTFKAMDFVASENHPYSIMFNLPFLRSLEFSINEYVDKVEVFSAPCLERASISSYAYFKFKNFASVNLGLVTSVVMVSSLNLDFNVLKSLSLAALPSNFTFPRLTYLELFLNVQTMDIDKRMFNAFIWLLRSMPLLKVLDLQLGEYSIVDDRVDIQMGEFLLKNHHGISCLDHTLKCVKIRTKKLNSVMTSITLVKFLLLNAKVLKLMKVAYWTGSEVEQSVIEVLQNVKETTSSNAKVAIIRRRISLTSGPLGSTQSQPPTEVGKPDVKRLPRFRGRISACKPGDFPEPYGPITASCVFVL
ncbi:hypothetical protein LUZ61_007824 [Rhynchospora tenuis]|uniref:F-box domain-containing protein n=1 Tax=Rhynchospora tenuis TaxID=198213 RepID=A0AAD5ZU64_9POAL|nr:hypothetical protein LUZ61_007824 [Rhynchospora tenuis]